jgi:hypothetical protein
MLEVQASLGWLSGDSRIDGRSDKIKSRSTTVFRRHGGVPG